MDGSFVGTARDDRLRGTAGADALVGLGGDDIYTVNHRGDRVFEDRQAGDDTVRASVDHRLANYVETLLLVGRAAIDGTGNKFDNLIRGNDAANVLDGGKGDDRIFGGGGRDVILGGRGFDKMDGGDGADSFVFETARDSRAGRKADVILDFTRKDAIDLSGIDADTGRARNQAFDYVGKAEFSEHAGELRFHRGVLEADLDGDGSADFALLLEDVTRLSVGDLVL